jgi:hypothetical protein
MEKFILKNGKEVEMGDKLIKHGVTDTLFGKRIVMQEIIVNEKTLPELIKAGVLTPMKECTHKADCLCRHHAKGEVPMDMNFYIEKIADRLGWKPEKVYSYLNNVDSILPAAAFSMVLREIAIELDKKYEDHIENSPEIFVISMLDGRITKAKKAYIKNYRNFAAFRTIEDAKIACRIVKPILKDMFKSKDGK